MWLSDFKLQMLREHLSGAFWRDAPALASARALARALVQSPPA